MKPHYPSMVYAGLSYQSKLLLSYLLLLVLPISALSLFSLHNMSNMAESQMRTSAQYAVEQAQKSAENQLRIAMDTARSMTVLKDLRAILSRDPASLTMAEAIDDLKHLNSAIEAYKLRLDSQSVRFYVNDAFLYSRSQTTVYPLSQFASFPWSSPLIDGTEAVCISPLHSYSFVLENTMDVVSVCMAVKHEKNLLDICGVISIDIPAGCFLDILRHASVSDSSHMALYDENGGRIASTSEDPSADPFPLQMPQPINGGEGLFDGYIVTTAQMHYSGWHLICLTPLSALQQQANEYRFQLIAMCLLIGLVVYLCAWQYAKNSASSIRKLQREMDKVKHGDYTAACIVDRLDEIGEMQLGFNAMVHKIKDLLDERSASDNEKRNLELKVLQSKINPHFLYNTLDLISWSADDPTMVRTILVKLSQFYRLSLSGGSDFIPLREEIEHVRLYMDIQNIRYQSAIRFNVDLPRELEDFPVMKLLLQPIVENSVVHGLRPKLTTEGEIQLSVQRVQGAGGDRMVLRIQDNGTGISNEAALPGATGYGLRNIRERLAMYYGHEASLETQNHQGTLVVIQIPLDNESN